MYFNICSPVFIDEFIDKRFPSVCWIMVLVGIEYPSEIGVGVAKLFVPSVLVADVFDLNSSESETL